MQPELELQLIDNTIRPFMKRQRYGVVASISSTGNPHSAVVGIAVTDEIEVIFDTLSATRKYRNLTTNPRCSMVFFDGEKTLQFEGLVFEPRERRYRAIRTSIFRHGQSVVSIFPGQELPIWLLTHSG